MRTTGMANFPLPKHSVLEATLWLGGTSSLINYVFCAQMFPSPKVLRPEDEEFVSKTSEPFMLTQTIQEEHLVSFG